LPLAPGYPTGAIELLIRRDEAPQARLSQAMAPTIPYPIAAPDGLTRTPTM